MPKRTSEAFEHYLRLESVMLWLDSFDSPEAEPIRSVMDSLWLLCTPEERRKINEREVRCRS